MSHQSDRRPATADRRYYKSKKSYDEALSTLAATLPLVSQRRSSLTANARASTGPRGRKGSRTGGKYKYILKVVPKNFFLTNEFFSV